MIWVLSHSKAYVHYCKYLCILQTLAYGHTYVCMRVYMYKCMYSYVYMHFHFQGCRCASVDSALAELSFGACCNKLNVTVQTKVTELTVTQ